MFRYKLKFSFFYFLIDSKKLFFNNNNNNNTCNNNNHIILQIFLYTASEILNLSCVKIKYLFKHFTMNVHNMIHVCSLDLRRSVNLTIWSGSRKLCSLLLCNKSIVKCGIKCVIVVNI